MIMFGIFLCWPTQLNVDEVTPVALSWVFFPRDQFSMLLYVTHHDKSRLCHQKSKFVLFSHEILCCKTFQMTYYLFIYDVPNRSCVILKYSRVENYGENVTKFGKHASLATHTYSKTIRMQVFLRYITLMPSTLNATPCKAVKIMTVPPFF